MMLAYKNCCLTFFAVLLLFSGCHPAGTASGNSTGKQEKPAWLQEKITAFEREKPANPPVKIYRYRYNGQPVFFITGRCCDIPSQLFTVEGQQLCQPDGGLTGRGDGKCADFFDARTDEKLIWEDLRK